MQGQTPIQQPGSQTSNPNPGRLVSFFRFVWTHKWLTTIISLLLITLILILITPEQNTSELPAPQLGTETTAPTKLTSAVFTGAKPKLPDELAVYQGETQQASVEDFMLGLAAQLGLTRVEGVKYLWIDNTGRKTLSYNQSQHIVTFVIAQNEYEIDDNQAPLDIEKIVQRAELFLNNELSLENFEPNRTDIRFIGNESEADISNARFYAVPFTSTLDGLPIKLSTSLQPPVLISVNSLYEIFRVDVYVTLPKPSQPISYTPLTTEQALENIRQNNATIISSSIELGGIIELDRIQKYSFSSATLQYRYDPTNNLYYPYYEFSGTASTDRPDEAYSIVVITPAVATISPSN